MEQAHDRSNANEQEGCGSGPEDFREESGGAEPPPRYDMGALPAQGHSPFTLSIDHLAGTVRLATVAEVKKRLGGEWEKGKGFRGYPESWICRDGNAVTLMGYGARDRPGEVHFQLAGQVCQSKTYEELQSLVHWIQRDKQGHLTRLDVAFDDRAGVMSVQDAVTAVRAGQCVTRSRKWNFHSGGTIESGKEEGGTLYIGSRLSNTFTRIYDKAAEQRSKGHAVEGPWARVETEYADERAESVGMCLAGMDLDKFRVVAIGFLRQAVDFRATTPDMEDYDRSRAPLLPWWARLTEGLKKCQMVIQKTVKTIEEVCEWVEKSLTPMLAVIVAGKERGEEWLLKVIAEGVERWSRRHLDLVRSAQDLQRESQPA
jgi:phage replication initiation protein